MDKKKVEKGTFTKYERARAMGARALQISMGAPFTIKISKKELEELNYNPVKIAILEYKKGALPITVKKISSRK